jgi:hypothetical protein
MQRTYNVTLCRVRVTTVAVDDEIIYSLYAVELHITVNYMNHWLFHNNAFMASFCRQQQ